MDISERVAFVFGASVSAATWETADAREREELMDLHLAAEGDGSPALRTAVATQLLDDTPPQVWRTARRLADAGLDPGAILSQLAMAFAQSAIEALQSDDFDEDAYVARLGQLPLPEPGEVERAVLDVAAEHVVIGHDELTASVAQRLGDHADGAVAALIERIEQNLADEWGPLGWLAGDRTVHIGQLCAGIVLTHVLTESEREIGLLHVSVDLAGFNRIESLTIDGAHVEPISLEHGHVAWAGPDGWLDGFAVGTAIAVRVDDDGAIDLRTLPSAPDPDPRLVTAVGQACDEVTAEPGLPASCEDLVLSVLVDDRAAFSEPRAPLSALCEAAGLELRGSSAAGDPEVFDNALHLQRWGRLTAAADGDADLAGEVLRVLELADDLAASEAAGSPAPDAASIRDVLDAMDDPHVLAMVSDELFDDEGVSPSAAPLAAGFVNAANRPGRRATARLIAALAAERDGDWAAAEQHLELAVEADRRYLPAVDRLAWYASDRGDAARAAKLWRSVPLTGGTEQDLATVEPFALASSGRPGLGRNDRCWCGSGRKYKHCHLGVPEVAALPDRVGWLCRKAVGYIERSAPGAHLDLVDVVGVLTESQPHDATAGPDWASVMQDPLVMDLVLTEGGWFEDFVADRGALLPDDEALLATAWLTVERTVYEVVSTTPGSSMTVRDLRTGDRLDVREATLSGNVAPGMLLCGRAVPDGERHQFIGGLFGVRPGQEAALLAVLDEGDPLAVAKWVSDLRAPPQLRTRENEHVVECETVVTTDDLPGLIDHLNAAYTTDVPGEVWTEHHELDDVESVIRASLRLDGRRLTVTTNSVERADRVMDRLRGAVDVEVVAQTRTPVTDVGDIAGTARGGLPDLQGLSGGVDADVMADIQRQMELRWCDERVPALGGVTPRQAAADPTRREQLERLLDSFDAAPAPPGVLTFRTDHVRAELGL
ncbi:MAG: SEC-C metal-binding domain-containing protein [Egibacteraceae bacterium]